ncbi:hypothetical protein [Deefgea rivuli]|uniref:hypothetical protein n=1 Tax=Deefgea rivuli TaxID=400948 RepID=UPI000486A17F|nr:hypothetical protein [Deefgea rivuli]
MNEHSIEIGGIKLSYLDIKKYWVDSESSKEKAIRNYYQENNYIGGWFSLLIAGLFSQYLKWKKKPSPTKKYLHIRTKQNTAYCFSEDEININDVLLKLKK